MSSHGGRGAHLAALVLLVVLLAVLPAIPSSDATSPASVPASIPLAAPAASAIAPPSPAGTPAVPGAGPAAGPAGISPTSAENSSGPGVFYSSRALQSASFANETCVGGLCYNDSNDVAVNYTRTGVLAVAYTTLTNRAPCPAMRPFSVSNIAFVSSTNLGRTWTHVRYLGNPVCTGVSAGYPDAWEPSLTSLSNGTLVLVYVEFNLSAGSLPPLLPYSWPPVESRLVLTESFDGGNAWTTPQVLNISNPSTAPPGVQYTPALPSVTAYGRTIYVTWMSLSFEDSEGAIALLVSTNGGAVWSPTLQVSTGYGAFYSMDPQALVTPSGELVIAYTSNVSYNYGWCTGLGCYYFAYGTWTGNVWVASSVYNGTVFNYTMVAGPVPLDSPGWGPLVNPAYFGPFQTPAPQLAYSPASGRLFVVFTAGTATNGSEQCFEASSDCLAGDLYFYTSSNRGATWTPGNIGNVVFNPANIDPGSNALNATDTVTSVAIGVTGKTVDIEAGFYNGSVCFGARCGAATEVVFGTANSGMTFTNPAVVTSTYTPEAYAWNGEYGSVDVIGSSPLFFWSSNTCPAWRSSFCGGYPYSDLPVAQVELSTPYSGASSSVFFNATGIPADVNWSISVLGNIRTGAGHSSLSVSGVPDGLQILWSAANVNLTTAHYLVAPGGVTPPSPQVLAGTIGVGVTYDEYVPVTIGYNVPSIGGIECYSEFGIGVCPTFYPTCAATLYNEYAGCYSLYFNPIPPSGQQWRQVGQPVSIGLNQLSVASTCTNAYGFCEIWMYNLTLLGWSGTGPGSISSPLTNITFSPTGPVTESASFVITGVCNWQYDTFGIPPFYLEYCDTYTSPLTIAEHGLPTGTTWGVTLSGAAGSGSISATAPEEIENASAEVGFGGISIFNVPSANPNYVWEGTSDVGSTLLLPYTSTVVVNYTLVPLDSLLVPLHLAALGLPTGLAGNLTITDDATSATTAYSVPTGGLNESLAGGSYTVNASAIVTTTGISYLVAEVYVTSAFVNNTNQSALNPATVLLGGDTDVTVAYQAEYWVDISSGIGGQTSPASRWVDAGSTITLRATANAGYHFLDWVGTGPGATSGPQATLSQVVIQPGGPVTELATFAANAASTWTVTIQPSGLPASAEASVSLGGTTYSGAGTFEIGNISSGTYSLAFPNVAGVGSAVSEYTFSSDTASTGLSGSQLTVTQDLTVYPVYETQYLVAITVVGSGSLSVATGLSWQAAESTLTITATPATGYVFDDWTGSFDGGGPSVLSNSTTLDTVLTGSLELVGWFAPAPPAVVATYSYLLNETGLPSGTAWQFGVASGPGAAGVTSSLTLYGLKGTYTLEVPTVYTSAGIRFVPQDVNGTSVALSTVDLNSTVSFQEQFLVIAAASGPGSVGGGGWYPAGATISLTAAAAGVSFAGWQGVGPGSYSGMSLSPKIVVSGPVTETASFSSSPVAANTGPSTPVLDYVGIALVIAVLLAVGVAEGYVAGRRRRPPAGPRTPPPAATPAPGVTPASPVPAPMGPVKPADWSEN
jgi:Divergent InlB B-repeat domain